MSSLLLLTSMLVVIGSTCPPTICIEFLYWVRHLFLLQSTTRVITECESFFITMYDKSYYKVRQLFSYKVRRMLLQSVAAFFITSCDFISLESYEKMLWQSATAFYQKLATILLQSVTGIAKCDRYYKVLRIFQSTTEQLTTFTTHYFN